MAVACLAALAGCGSGSTGRTSADAVNATAREFGGPDVKLYASQLTVENADGEWRHIVVVTACRPEGGCTLIAPDGVRYPDVQALIDDTEFIEPGETVLANPNMTSPDETPRLEKFTKSTGPPWAWLAGGGALVAALLVAAVVLVRTRRRRSAEQALLGEWETPGNGD